LSRNREPFSQTFRQPLLHASDELACGQVRSVDRGCLPQHLDGKVKVRTSSTRQTKIRREQSAPNKRESLSFVPAWQLPGQAVSSGDRSQGKLASLLIGRPRDNADDDEEEGLLQALRTQGLRRLEIPLRTLDLDKTGAGISAALCTLHPASRRSSGYRFNLAASARHDHAEPLAPARGRGCVLARVPAPAARSAQDQDCTHAQRARPHPWAQPAHGCRIRLSLMSVLSCRSHFRRGT